ncbi:roadblock/LC7 domain-containing protein [Desulfuromonas sp. TF]|jgi:predicted regulator of Ras-like GTPase activity (Roadblock/LC7/MglB family)|uniref:roadblock/LC7 domain-containing protein n=1 Tax=Desulfuromonas sp. TF TaxID=1232410 RepID=UPI0004099F5A|nr:roadblock/LC7 domain-containing protein [Desulfuromonas sp. TF]
MSFKTLLGELVFKVPGALGAILADWEGEAVDQSGHLADYELKVIGAHKGVILQNLREVVGRLEDDQVREIVVTTEKVQTVIMPVTPDYFLVLTLNRDDVLGRALFEARRCVALLKKEID